MKKSKANDNDEVVVKRRSQLDSKDQSVDKKLSRMSVQIEDAVLYISLAGWSISE
jgi:hypothetical protein